MRVGACKAPCTLGPTSRAMPAPEAELVAEVTKAQIKFEMLQDQLKLLQGQVANARTHLEELTRKLDRARSHKARDPGLTALNERFVELGDDSMDTIAEERRQSATSTAARTSASADESKRKRPMGEPETAKEKEKRQRLEHLQSMLPAEVDMGAKSRPAARPPAPQMPREQNGVTVFNSGRPSGPAHGSSAPTAVPEPKRKVVMQTSNPRPASATPAPDDPNVETDKFSGLRLVYVYSMPFPGYHLDHLVPANAWFRPKKWHTT